MQVVQDGIKGVNQMTNEELVDVWRTHFYEELELVDPGANPNSPGGDAETDSAVKFTVTSTYTYRDLPETAVEALGGQAGAESWLERHFRYIAERLTEVAKESCIPTLPREDHLPME